LVPAKEGRPDVIVTYGGDGTLLGAERDFPSVPKMAIRRHIHCHYCARHRPELMLKALAEDRLQVESLPKLEASTGGQRVLGLNDIILHNIFVSSGVRFLVWINGERYRPGEIVGDGLIAATPFGSTAYYRSITQSLIHTGIGLAFNNTTEPINHLVLREDEEIFVQITRGPAVITADNHPNPIPLDFGDEVRIAKAPESARLIMPYSLRCPDCRKIRPAIQPSKNASAPSRAIASH
jgi:NAD+ kinase